MKGMASFNPRVMAAPRITKIKSPNSISARSKLSQVIMVVMSDN
jgi:hypothetical protein